jgi:hypothetical protein
LGTKRRTKRFGKHAVCQKKKYKIGTKENVTIEETGYIEKKPVLCIDVGQ